VVLFLTKLDGLNPVFLHLVVTLQGVLAWIVMGKFHPNRCQASERLLTKEARLENGPHFARENVIADVHRSGADMCPACLTRRHGRWP
jgi:hypothetical protein